MKKLLIFILMFLLILAGCSTKSDTLKLKGCIENNIIPATSTVSGKIVQMNKNQGETVKKGEIIALIDDTNQKYAVEQLQAAVNMKKAKLDELQAGSRSQQIDQAQAQVSAYKAQLDLASSGAGISTAEEAVNSAQTSYDFAETQYKTVLELYNSGAESKNNLDQAKYKLDTANNQLSTAKTALENATVQSDEAIKAAKASYDAANEQLSLLQSGSTKYALDVAKADLDQASAQLNQAKYILNNHSIAALADGIIISKNYELGDVVNVSSDIADIAVSDDLYVTCYVPERYLDKIYYGQQLNVNTSQGDQTGQIIYIALEDVYTPEDMQTSSDKKNRSFKIKVLITDERGILKSGMTANVELPLTIAIGGDT